MLTARFDVLKQDGILSIHLIEGDPNLSRLLVPNANNTGAGDWYMVIDGTSVEAVSKAADERFITAESSEFQTISLGIYRFLADISSAELDR